MICRNHVDVSAGVRRCSRCGVTFCKDCLVDIGGQPYCATCKGEQLLDVRSGVDRTNLEFAGIGRRFAAQLLDGLVIGVPVGIILVGFMIVSMNGNKPPTQRSRLAPIIVKRVPVVIENSLAGQFAANIENYRCPCCDHRAMSVAPRIRQQSEIRRAQSCYPNSSRSVA